MSFEIIGEIEDVEIIAIGGNIRDIMRIQLNLDRLTGEKLKDLLK